MFFKNVTQFRFSPQIADSLDDLESELAKHPLRACGPAELATCGFVAPIPSNDDSENTVAFTHSVNGVTLIAVGGETKLLPSSVINDELAKRIAKIRRETGRPPGGRERKRLKEEILMDLLPRAFLKRSRTFAYLDKARGRLVVNTSGRKGAEGVVTQIREALGSFPALPLQPEESVRVLMTDWVAKGRLPEGLQFGDECELRDPVESGARWRGRNTEMETDEVREHLKSGKQVYLLSLVFDERISFVLGEDLVLRKVKLLDVALDSLDEKAEDPAAALDAAFTLMSLEYERLFAKLDEWFKIERPKDKG